MIITFELKGENALWQLPSEALGRYSAPIPSPSQIAGILGSALGHKLSGKERKTGGWEMSSHLICWLKENKPKVTIEPLCPIRRESHNTNGFKTPKESPASYGGKSTLRILQKIIREPHYRVAIQIQNEAKGTELLKALRNPTYPIYLGNTHHWGKILNAKIEGNETTAGDWATYSKTVPNEDYNWHTIIDLTQKERVIFTGFWRINNPPEKKAMVDSLTLCCQ